MFHHVVLNRPKPSDYAYYFKTGKASKPIFEYLFEQYVRHPKGTRQVGIRSYLLEYADLLDVAQNGTALV
jgi:hypothetical protein